MNELLVRIRDVAIGSLPIAALITALVLALGAAAPAHRRVPLASIVPPRQPVTLLVDRFPLHPVHISGHR